MARPDIGVPGDQGVRPPCQGGGVQLKEGGKVVGVGHRDKVVDRTSPRVTQLITHHVPSIILIHLSML